MPIRVATLVLLAGCARAPADTASPWPDVPPSLRPFPTPCPVVSLAFVSAARGVIACADRPWIGATRDGGSTWAWEVPPAGVVPGVAAVTPHASDPAVPHVVDVVPDAGRVHLLLLCGGRQVLQTPRPGRPPPELPEDFEARALAVGRGGAVLVGGEREGSDGDPRAVLAWEAGGGWIRPDVPPGAGAVEDLAPGPGPTTFVAVGRATLAREGGYALVTHDPAEGVQVRSAPVPLVAVGPAGVRFLARGDDGSVWVGDFPGVVRSAGGCGTSR